MRQEARKRLNRERQETSCGRLSELNRRKLYLVVCSQVRAATLVFELRAISRQTLGSDQRGLAPYGGLNAFLRDCNTTTQIITNSFTSLSSHFHQHTLVIAFNSQLLSLSSTKMQQRSYTVLNGELSFQLSKVSVATDAQEVTKFSWNHRYSDLEVRFDNYGSSSSNRHLHSMMHILQLAAVVVRTSSCNIASFISHLIASC